MPAFMHYEQLKQLGIRLVINMRFSRRPVLDTTEAPIKLLWLPTIDSPFFPMPIDKLIQGTRAALDTIRKGGGVYVHCAYGRHRSVVMGACILIAQGMSIQEALELIKKRRPSADPDVFYMKSRILRFASEWKLLGAPALSSASDAG
jgi:protein-tyrosine phosphatase